MLKMPENGETINSNFGRGELMVSDFSLFTNSHKKERGRASR
jgi:hypothetical protein